MSAASTRIVPVLGVAGLVTALIGTFLPWLRSGQVHRNSYTSFGLLRRLIGFHGVAEVLIRAWPLLGMACALVVLVAVAGLLRAAALLALLVGAWSAAIAGGALAHDPVGNVRIDTLGPIVTVVGATTTITAAILTLISQVSHQTGGTRRDRATGDAERSER
ncbi:MAG TPA: hypothetical protein VE074_13090 [Jatrophihabitantaceae bacterium]|nr:hypothetical protein [Jatrophihabitantaceae bacterium]